MNLQPIRCLVALTLCFVVSLSAHAIDDVQLKKAKASTARGIEFLRNAQNKDGSWSSDIVALGTTGLVVAVLLDQPDIDRHDPAVKKGLAYILSHAQDNGAIDNGKGLVNYNTSICLSALARVRTDPHIAEVCRKGEQFLKQLQYDDIDLDENGEKVTKEHAFYGGWGYGKHGRPDGSNTQFAVQALHDLGVDCNDPVYERAMVYITRLQGADANKVHGDKIEQDGGSIYATSVNKDNVGTPQSMASPEQIERVKSGKPINARLRTYGSMTYAMFKSYIYAQLDRDDERVKHAYKWIQHNYRFDQNPGMPEHVKMQGYYYYLITMSRALDAYNKPLIETAAGKTHNWANDLVEEVVKRQRKDGSWINEEDRWAESDPNLVTAYCLTALHHAMN